MILLLRLGAGLADPRLSFLAVKGQQCEPSRRSQFCDKSARRYGALGQHAPRVDAHPPVAV